MSEPEPLDSPNGLERRRRILARIKYIDTQATGWEARAEASALRWCLELLAHLSSTEKTRVADLCAYMRLTCDLLTVGTDDETGKADEIRDQMDPHWDAMVDDQRTLLDDFIAAWQDEVKSTRSISQAQAVAIIAAWQDAGSQTTIVGDPILDGLDLERLAIR